MRGSSSRSVFAAWFAALAVLAIAECIARATVPPPRAALQAVADARRRLGSCATAQAVGGEQRWVSTSANEVRRFAVPRRPQPGRSRVVVIGESGAAMLGDRLLELVDTRGLGETVEVLPCADEGASLEQIRLRFDEAVSVGADAVVLLLGHNLAIRYPTVRWGLRARDLLLRSRLVAGLASWLEPPPAAAPMDVSARRVAELRRWLRQAAVVARSRGARLVVVAVGANLEVPPPVPEHDYFDPDLLEARWLWAGGERERALGVLGERLSREPSAYLHFVRARWLDHSGRRDRALEDYAAARDVRQSPRDRATGAVLSALTELSDEEGVAVVAEGVAAEERYGWGRWRDHCHLTRAANFEVADRVLGVLQSTQGDARTFPGGPVETLATRLARIAGYAATGGRAGERRWRDAATTAVEYGFDYEDDAEAALAEFLAGPVLEATRPPAVRASVLEGIAEGLRAAGRRDLAAAVAGRARGLGQSSSSVQQALWSVADSALDRARAHIAAALEREPERPDALHYARRLAVTKRATPR